MNKKLTREEAIRLHREMRMSKEEMPLYLCDKKQDCNGPCYRYCRLTHDINHAVKDDEGNPIIVAYFEDPGDTWPGIKEVEK